ncbi:MAG: group III truncated hemoglobin [Saprospiraceae bacterium]
MPQTPKPDIKDLADIQLMVDAFYQQVKSDELLAPVFGTQAQVNWEAHLPAMYGFWQKVLLGQGDYRGNPFQKHIPLKIDATHFKRWLSLFIGTVDTHFSGVTAEEAKLRANTIAHIFQSKLVDMGAAP